MSDIGTHKLTEAIEPGPAGDAQPAHPTPEDQPSAEQRREAAEAEQAREAQASIRERMVDIGRGNQQAGRQGS